MPNSVLEVPSDNYYSRIIGVCVGGGGGEGEGRGTSVSERRNTCSLTSVPYDVWCVSVTIIMSGTQCSGAFTGHSWVLPALQLW